MSEGPSDGFRTAPGLAAALSPAPGPTDAFRPARGLDGALSPAPGLTDAFRPAPGLTGALRQTVVAAFLPARIPAHLPPAMRQEIAMRDGEHLGVLVTPARARARGRLVLLHGLGGCAESRYMRRTLALAWARDFAVARVQFRGAEPGASLRPSFHNAGRSEDLETILEGLVWPNGAADAPLAAIGFSLGGAVLLKHLGAAGAATRLAVAAAVSAPLDLAACLGALEEPRNRLYHRYYVHRLRRAVRSTMDAHPGSWPALDRSMNAVRRIDTRYIAPNAGYDSAESYYRGASSLPHLRAITAPTLLVSSRDDPFIPVSMFESLPTNGAPIETLLTGRGGHLGYLSWGRMGFRFWAGEVVLEWMDARLAPGTSGAGG